MAQGALPQTGGGLAGVLNLVMGFRRGDPGLTARANARLHKALGADAAGVRADAMSGSIALRGTVPSRDVATKAVEAVRRTRGAVDVMNFLEVR